MKKKRNTNQIMKVVKMLVLWIDLLSLCAAALIICPGKDRWEGTDRQHNEIGTQYSLTKELGISSESQEAAYFRAPRK